MRENKGKRKILVLMLRVKPENKNHQKGRWESPGTKTGENNARKRQNKKTFSFQ